MFRMCKWMRKINQIIWRIAGEAKKHKISKVKQCTLNSVYICIGISVPALCGMKRESCENQEQYPLL